MCNSSCGKKKSVEKYFLEMEINHEKVDQLWQKLNLILKYSYWSFLPTFVHICEKITKKSPENKFWKRAITHEKVGQSWRKLNLICTS